MLAGVAQAVMVSPNGLGQVLIYPYYTVRNGNNVGDVSATPYNTLLSVVNTTDSTKAVKVRFREGKASRKSWTSTSSCRRTTSGRRRSCRRGRRRKIETADKVLHDPDVPGGARHFRTTISKDDNAIGGGEDRLTEGYFEVFEMATYAATDAVAIGAKHTSAGVPKDCSAVNDTSAAVAPLQPNGGLSGAATLVNVLTGDAFTEYATALTQFNVNGGGAYFNTGSRRPDFTQASPAVVVRRSLRPVRS